MQKSICLLAKDLQQRSTGGTIQWPRTGCEQGCLVGKRIICGGYIQTYNEYIMDSPMSGIFALILVMT